MNAPAARPPAGRLARMLRGRVNLPADEAGACPAGERDRIAGDLYGVLAGALADDAALAELRRLLMFLAPGAEPQAGPVPGLDELAALTERAKTAGIAARLVVSGARDGVPAGQALCAYRVAEAALDEAALHSAAGQTVSALVHVDRAEAELTLRVVHTGTGGEHPGIRARALAYGGSVEIGPRPCGGFGVLLRLPLPT